MGYQRRVHGGPRKTNLKRENTSHRESNNFKSKCWESLQHQETLYRIILPVPVRNNRFSPYNDNGGSTVAIAGDDFAIVASDTRLTDGGYGILSRTQPKLFNLTGNICLGATGCWADVLTLTRLMGVRIKMFKYTHNNTIQTKECAQMLSTMLYAKRFFPYSVTNILAGLNSEGKGVIYGYDPVGCIEELVHVAGGAGVTLMQSLLDNQVDKK